MRTSDAVIVGGGIIGLSTAYALARSGVSVTVLDAGEPGQASTAAAGMLAPLAEAKHLPHAFVALALQSLALYPALTAELWDKTEIDARPYGPGMLRVACTEQEECDLQRHQDGLPEIPLSIVSQDTLRRLEPELACSVRMAVLSPQERSVDPSRLHAAFRRGCLLHGVKLCEGTPVVDLTGANGRIVSVTTPQGSFAGDVVMIAGGAWSARIAQRLGISLPVRPVRGQILALGPCLPPTLRHTIYSPSGYLVPRADGRLIVGATEEEAGFDAGTTADGITGLLAMAHRLVPGLIQAPLHSQWAGLRPVCADGLPIIGHAPAWQNVYLGTGHGRNGILLAPITACLLAQAILQGTPTPEAFSPTRFEASL